MTDEKGLEPKKDNTPVVYDPILNEGMDALDPSEIIISRALIQQAMSKRVQDGKATQGQILDSVDGTLLAEPQTPLEIICFHPVRQWIEFIDRGTGKADYLRTKEMTPENMNLEWEETTPDGVVKRNKALGYFFLIPSEIAENTYFPRLALFTRTSYKAGRKISTMQAKLKAAGRPLCTRVFKLCSLRVTNDKGTFNVFDVDSGRDATDAEVQAALRWKKVIMTGVEVHKKDEVPF